MANRSVFYKWIPAHSFKQGRTYPIRNIVLHSSDGREAGDIATLTGDDVSSHWYVTRQGRIYHFVADGDTAYHAGKVFNIEYFSNSATVGIEQEHIDGQDDWPSIQITAVAKLVAYLLQAHGLHNRVDIKTHAEIARPHGRKVDPEGYPFSDFYDQVDGFLADKWSAVPEGHAEADDDEDSFAPVAMTRSFQHCRVQVHNRGVPSDAFLNQLVDWALVAPDSLFAVNSLHDIYSNVVGELGPWRNVKHRKAAMLEVLRVLGGFESSWNWKEGRDTSNPNPDTPCNEEAGMFQCSGDSMDIDSSLKSYFKSISGGSERCEDFITLSKSNHTFAIEYCARLLRFTVDHHGPVKRRKINPWLRKEAVEEFLSFL